MEQEENDVKSLRELVTALLKDMRSVKTALLGDEFNPVGYLKRLEIVEKTQEKFESKCDIHKAEIEKYKNRIFGGAMVIIFLWTVATATIGFFIIK